MDAVFDPGRPFVLENTVQEYAWGSPTAIPELLGQANPNGTPQAELWMGAHPKAPSRVAVGDRHISLAQLIESYPKQLLGETVLQKFGARLPFLFKVLAASNALSIQAHPNLDQARVGYQRENDAGIAIDAPERNYRDDNHKPEVLCALGDFWGMRGFRPPEQIRRDLVDLSFEGAARLAETLSGQPVRTELKEMLRRLLETDSEVARRMADSAASICRSRKGDRYMWVDRLSREFPGDVGVIAPLFLNVVHLKPGQAVYQGAGELHAYLEGTGIELMANSDNVLRGGLTPKHIDVSELLRVLVFEEGDSSVLEGEPGAAGELTYRTPAAEFRLSRIETKPSKPFAARPKRTVEILLCISGECRLEAAGGIALPLRRGESVLVPAAAPSYGLSGTAEIFRADVPFSGES